MKYYLSVTERCQVEQAITRTQMDQFVQLDLTRDQILEKYNSLDQLVLYSDPTKAVEAAREKYYKKRFSDIKQDSDTLVASKDRLLISRFGENCLFVRKSPVDFLMEVEVADESILQKTTTGLLEVSLANKDKLALNFVIAGPYRIENTEAFAKENHLPLTEHLIKPTNFQSCKIL